MNETIDCSGGKTIEVGVDAYVKMMGLLSYLKQKDDEYRWHDIRKYKNDLPGRYQLNDDMYLVCVNGKHGPINYDNAIMAAYWDGEEFYAFSEPFGNDTEVIAWKRIEEFEDGEGR